MLIFQPGQKYSRPDVKELAGLPRDSKGGNWDTGIVDFQSQFLIFANVGIPGRTGHDYDNRWEGDLFRWYHKSHSRISWPSVQQLLEERRIVHLFWRNSGGSDFEYAGLAKPIDVMDTSPVEILWQLDTREHPNEVSWNDHYEGALRRVPVNAYERDRAARRACIDHYGSRCTVCDLCFEERYGKLGAGFIHVHHLVPLSELGANYKVNPIKDLRPICPNCHAMVHLQRPPLSIEEIRNCFRD